MERQYRRRFHVIDRSQVDAGQDALVVSCCDDCACPTPAFSSTRAPGHVQHSTAGLLVRAANLHYEALLDGYWAVFNPSGNSGIVVLNDASRSLLDAFSTPTQLADVEIQHEDRLDTEIALSRLIVLELVHPVGHPVEPVFAEDDELVVWFHVTNQCNLACTYCYVRQTNEHMSLRVGYSAVDAVVRSAREGGYRKIKLKYAGGEASLVLQMVYALHDYAVKKCEANDLGLRAVLLSNGLGLLNQDVAGLRERSIRVMVSIDGLDSAHDRQRPLHGGKPTARKVLEAIEYLQQADVDIHLSVTVTTHNCVSLDEFVRYAIGRDLSFSFNLYRETENLTANCELQYSEDRTIAGLQKAFQVAYEDTPRRTMIGTLLDRGNLLTPHTKACGVGQNYIVIDHHGNISKCHMMMNATIAGVSCDQPLLAVRQSDLGPHNPSVESKSECMSCKWRYYCTGGCPLAAYRATGHYDSRSPYCEVYQALYPMAVRLEGLRLLKYAPQYEVC